MSRTRIYSVWRNILARCENPNNTEYHNYGGRGVAVCPRWHQFENFLADMGEGVRGLTIERVDNDKGYEPGNCVWASHRQQGQNRRNNRWIAYNGETMILADWARRFEIDPGTLRRNWIREGIIKLKKES
jgi:hypothetical protein